MLPLPDRFTGTLSRDGIRYHAARALRFGLVSGLGLALDVGLFLTLVHAGVSAFEANVVSSAAGLTFVYCASVRRIFRYDGRFIVPLFAAYVAYHVCGTLFVSWAINGVVHLGVAPAIPKVGILPATFAANYMFMSWLTAHRDRWILRSRELLERRAQKA
jgi:putative flippase GtrA